MTVKRQLNLFIKPDLIEKLRDQAYPATPSFYIQNHLKQWFELKKYLGKDLLDVFLYKILLDFENMSEDEIDEYKKQLSELRENLEQEHEI